MLFHFLPRPSFLWGLYLLSLRSCPNTPPPPVTVNKKIFQQKISSARDIKKYQRSLFGVGKLAQRPNKLPIKLAFEIGQSPLLQPDVCLFAAWFIL
jgi:hypothetical protein